MSHTTFYDHKIIVDRLRYPLGAMHDGVPPSDIQTDPGGPVYGNMRVNLVDNSGERSVLVSRSAITWDSP